MQVYILMQSAGASAGPFGQAAQNADERRRAVCRAALRVSSVSGVGAAVGVTDRPLAPPLGELLSGCEAERASTPTNAKRERLPVSGAAPCGFMGYVRGYWAFHAMAMTASLYTVNCRPVLA